ncbi:MAG: hypothetical protein H6754_05705 [Candidatus Omnitrophica bacterium]|nr:hypothetical protein [Candidatus Omnitrophota bacterium]
MTSTKQSYLISRFVILLSFLIAVGLGIAIWGINPWPTDAEVYYMPAALRIPYVHYLSEIHITEGIENVRWLHGKELYVVAISVFQFLLNDFESIRPLMMLGLVAIAVSSILVFYISRKFWGDWIALFCYLTFVFCMWPYIYILFAKHQTLGLMFFLASVMILLKAPQTRWRAIWVFFSGLTFGLAFFSSTVSSLYVPYYAAGLFTVLTFKNKDNILGKVKLFVGHGLIATFGFMLVFFYVNLPDIALSIKNFTEYVHISGAFNHFYYNQPFLQQWFPHINVGEVRGGLLWIVKYFLLIMPVLFPLYVVAAGYLCWRVVQEKQWLNRLKISGVIVLSISSPLLAEGAKVAQYGANYFPALIGILFLVGFALHDFIKNFVNMRRQLTIVLSGVLVLHASINLYVFIKDVYVPRMATTFLSNKIKELNIDFLATYRFHFHRNHFIYCLNSQLREKIRWVGITSLAQLTRGGYALVPPPSGDSLYVASSTSYNNYDKDVVLVQLIRKGLLKDCAVASFRTLASSRIWQQEEEILSYRHLILNQRFPEDLLGRVWLLDAQKVKEQESKFTLDFADRLLLSGKVNNIGTAEKFYIFEGQRVGVRESSQVPRIITRIWKVGDPQDSLIASVYKTDPSQPIWLPADKNFTSKPLLASELQNNPQEALSIFTFDPPMNLDKGVYYFVVYRTGKKDDSNYYQIDNQRFGVQ